MRRLPTLTWVRFCLDTSVLVGPGYRDVVHEAGHHEHDLHRQVSHLHRSDVLPVWDRKASLSPVCLQTNQLVFSPPEQLPVSMELGWLVSVEAHRWAVITLTVHLLFSFLVHKGLTVWPQIKKCPNPNLWKRCWRSAWGIFPTFPLMTSTVYLMLFFLCGFVSVDWLYLISPFLQAFVPSAYCGHRPSHLLSTHPSWTQQYLQIRKWELL